MYKYFLSYFWLEDGSTGYGNCEVSLRDRINSIYEIDEIQKDIEQKYGYDKALILNYQIL